MQFRGHVRVVAGDAEGHSGRTLGQAELVTPECAVMRLGVREPTPSLPLHVVLVPVAAGGGRDEHDTTTGRRLHPDHDEHRLAERTIDVVEVLPAEDGSGDVALRLASGVPDPVLASSVSATPAQLASLSAGLAIPDSWICRKFPWLCR